MSELTVEQVREWIDTDLVDVEPVEDDHAQFNLAVQMSGMIVHVIRREPTGPIQVGQQIEFGEGIRERIQAMDDDSRDEVVARIREALMAGPFVYGFHDDRGNNVAFRDVHRIFLEARIYPDGASSQRLMDALVAVWKALRYLDDIWGLLESVEDY